MARVALYLFGVGWVIALVLEALARIGWRISPADAPRELRERENASHRKRRKRNPTPQEDDSIASAGLISSSRRWLQTAMKLILLTGSRLYHRVMLPPRSWDKQNLWHVAEDCEKQNSDTSPLDFEELPQESRPLKGKRQLPPDADSEKELLANGDHQT